MDIISSLIGDVILPRMAPVRQIFDDTALPDAEAALRDSFRSSALETRIAKGARIAVGVGSRGLADLPLLVRVTVNELRHLGADPFVVPAMGSHGGATAEGQVAVLAALGVTEESVGCPIRSSMDAIELGRLPNGLPVLMDRLAMEADGIAIINRVKPHTDFTSRLESGLAKMITIGLGKQKGAEACHALGFGEMAHNVLEMAKFKLANTPILFGVATVENAYDRIAVAEVIPAERILAREEELLRQARASMPRILFNPLDVLIVDRMGKEYSGAGMDPNITGRAGTPYINLTQQVAKMVVLDLSAKTHGNAAGMGLADICTRRLFEKIDFQTTYANHITSTILAGARIPMIMPNDRLAVQLAVKTCNAPDLSRVRIVRLANTLHLEKILISEPLLAEARENPAIEILEDPQDWPFDTEGTLAGVTG
jgi:hypothetical protein